MDDKREICPQEAYYNGLLHASGFRNCDLEKPMIGIVNSWNEVNPDTVLSESLHSM